MPSAAGIVLATLSGSLVAHEESRVPDPHGIARDAAVQRAPGVATSTLVQREGAPYLVVFVPGQA